MAKKRVAINVFNVKKKGQKTENPFISVFREHLPKQIIFIAIIVILVIFFINNLSIFVNFIKKLIGILMPIIIGFVLTYLMSPLYNLLVEMITKRHDKYKVDQRKRAKFARAMATLICAVAVILIAVGLIFLFVPQLYNSISSFMSRASGYFEIVKDAVEGFQVKTQIEAANKFLSELEQNFTDLINNRGKFQELDFSKVFVGVFNGFSVSLKMVLNVFVGFIVMIYTLNMKVELCTGAKRILFALFNDDVAKSILSEVRFANQVFSGFLVGKILDSLIIGVICYICCLIMQMPYTPLIAVIIGVTNIIPFFGPFIGAIPCFIIILLDQPFSWKPIGFLIFILILQQIDGNIIGPKILGDKTGVGSFWVLFSILLFGGLFGFIGMIIAVPLWAIITRLFDEFIVKKLKEKGQPLTVDEYARLKGYTEDLKKVKK